MATLALVVFVVEVEVEGEVGLATGAGSVGGGTGHVLVRLRGPVGEGTNGLGLLLREGMGGTCLLLREDLGTGFLRALVLCGTARLLNALSTRASMPSP